VQTGGKYRFQFSLSDPGIEAPVRVRAFLKATPDGTPPPTGTLDLNVWLHAATGVTPEMAAGDSRLQAGLAQFGSMLQGVGIALGDMDYFAYGDGSPPPGPEPWASLREAIPRAPGVVLDRLNVFLDPGSGGGAAQIPTCAVAWSNHSWALAGYNGNLGYLIAHECAHCLGLSHLGERPMDVASGSLPMNLMDVFFQQGGNTLSPMQGVVLRAHPFVR
jgi:hypothetical protein